MGYGFAQIPQSPCHTCAAAKAGKVACQSHPWHAPGTPLADYIDGGRGHLRLCSINRGWGGDHDIPTTTCVIEWVLHDIDADEFRQRLDVGDTTPAHRPIRCPNTTNSTQMALSDFLDIISKPIQRDSVTYQPYLRDEKNASSSHPVSERRQLSQWAASLRAEVQPLHQAFAA